MVIASTLIFFGCGAQAPQSDLVQFSYGTSKMAHNSGVSYSVTLNDDGTVTVSVGNPSSDERTFTADKEVLAHIRQIAEKYKLHKLKKYYKHKFLEVLDGTTWSICFRYADGTIINSGGHQM